MTKVGILDDEVIICETLSKYLKDLGYSVPDYALSYEEGLDLLNQQKPDIMLLDINIGGAKNGIDMAQFIRNNYDIPLIFISSYSDKNTVLQTKDVHPNGYLIKPFTKEDLFVAIETALSNFSSKSTSVNAENNTINLLKDALFIKQDSLFVKVYFKDILYIKSEGVYAEIFTNGKKYLIRETLKKLTEDLPSDLFFQIHRSYIINVNSIEAVNTEYVVVANESIPVSRSMRDDFLKRLNII